MQAIKNSSLYILGNSTDIAHRFISTTVSACKKQSPFKQEAYKNCLHTFSLIGKNIQESAENVYHSINIKKVALQSTATNISRQLGKRFVTVISFAAHSASFFSLSEANRIYKQSYQKSILSLKNDIASVCSKTMSVFDKIKPHLLYLTLALTHAAVKPAEFTHGAIVGFSVYLGKQFFTSSRREQRPPRPSYLYQYGSECLAAQTSLITVQVTNDILQRAVERYQTNPNLTHEAPISSFLAGSIFGGVVASFIQHVVERVCFVCTSLSYSET